MNQLSELLKKVVVFPFSILSLLVGKFSYSSPAWAQNINQYRKSNPGQAYGIIAILFAVFIAYQYYDSLPKPIKVKATHEQIAITPNYENAKPSNLNIEFNYDFSELHQDQARPEGVPSIARIDLIGKEIKQGIGIQPAKEGTWEWLDDRRLRFVPETDWPAGTEYKVNFDKSLFINEAVLSDSSLTFRTPVLSAEFVDTQFYQDPQDISVRRVISTLRFTHPVDKNLVEKNLLMTMRPSNEAINVSPTNYNFSVTYDKNYREAYIQSEPVRLPEQSNYMKMTLKEGVKSILGGEATNDIRESKVLIPDIYSFLKVNHASTQIVRNEKNEPEQILTLEFTDDIHKKELLGKFGLYLLPGRNQAAGKRYWRGPREVNDYVLKNSDVVEFRMVENEREHSKNYSFIIDVPENRSLYVKIDKGLVSVNKFVYSSFYDNVLHTPKYPKEVNIAGEGSLLTFSGNHQLSVLTRGVPGLKYTIGRLLKGEINHLISQTGGDINNPSFSNWNFSEQNISQYDSREIALTPGHPKLANYSSIDLTQYLPRQTDRFGLFFINVQAWDPVKEKVIYGVSDKRLIMVTDLGIIVKNNTDKSHDIFVQSVANGKPVNAAKVDLLGKNGIPIFTGKTDVNGHVRLPVIKDYKNEQYPTVYVVKKANDLSFIPYNRQTRQINLSKFDIGGVKLNQYQRDSLNAYLFSDRGIYRPGETINVGMIVKNLDFSNIEDIPLEVVVRGPRNKELKVNKFNLAEKGFTDFQYETDATSPTGQYKVSLHLIRDNKYRGREIGYTNFKLEEFQPDTMKIQSKLADVVDKGWNTQEKLVSQVTLKNLFGVPAQDRRMTGRVIIQPKSFSFKKFKGYTFTDPFLKKDKKPLSIDKYLGDQKTDADGLANFEMDLSNFREGTYQLKFIAEGFDQGGGRSVIASNTALISPLQSIVGYKANGKLDYINSSRDRAVQFVVVDKSLNKIDRDDLVLRLKEIQHVSTLVRQYNGTYKYQTITKEKVLNESPLAISEKGYDYKVDTETAGEFALEVLDKKGLRLSRLTYSVVGFANLAGKIDKNAELQLKLNKSDYLPGETIEMNIKAPYTGSGLITIETDRVHQFKWFNTNSESTVQQIQIPADLEGTGYINVAFVRDVSSKEVFTSPLSYAVQPFSIDQSKRRIDITLETGDIVRPGKPMEIGFTASQASRIAIFAIDEGILQVARYKTPDPLAHFLKKRALGVETLQILDLILPDFDLIKELSASGGGSADRAKALANNLNPFSRKTDKPAVYWSGIYDASTKKNKVIFDVPNTFAGELRVMAVAVADEAVGASSTSSIVRGPFVISPNVLTQTAPGDMFKVTVGVANIIDGSGKNAEVSLMVSSSEHLEIVGKKQATLKIDEGSEDKFTFDVKAKNKLGAAELLFTARYKNEESSRTASLSIRPATPYHTSFVSGYDDDGKVSIGNLRSLYTELSEQSVSASASPLVIVDGLNAYLKSYPHGCTEQVVSKVFPLVGLMNHPAYAPHVTGIQQSFEVLISKLRERQLGSGGFAFWPGQQNSAEYPSVYVMHFLLEASELGYPVPADMLQRGKDYLKSYIQNSATSLGAARDRANAIYLLTRMGEVTTNYLVDLEEYLKTDHKKVWRSDITASYMAATYQLLQKTSEAERLIDGYKLAQERYPDLDDLHSLLSVDAQYIYLLSRHFESKARNLDGEAILKLTQRIFKGEYNTISSAYSILALGSYSKLVLGNNANENIRFSMKDSNNKEQELKAALLPFMKALYPVEATSLDIAYDKSLFYLNVQSGFNLNPQEKALKQGLEIFREFVDDEGNIVTSFAQGKELTVKLKIRTLDGKLHRNIAIIDLLPGGFEVIRSSVSRTAYNWRADYIDIREDRVVFYGDVDGSVRELSYKVKLSSAGTFIIPSSYAESMYDRSLRAISEAGKFVVTDTE